MVSQAGARSPSALAPLGPRSMAGSPKRASRASTPYRSRLPVICIGNFTAGGGGKTPTAIADRRAARRALAPGPLSSPAAMAERARAGSGQPGQSAAEVGDEPLLLAEAAPTLVSADRAAGAKAIEATEAERHRHG